MIKKFTNLNKAYQIGFITLFISLLGFIATSFLLKSSMDIPLGIIVSGALFSILNFLQGLTEKLDASKGSIGFSIGFISLKFAVVVAFVILAGFMSYRWNANYINIFCVVGVYTVSILATVLVYILRKE